MITIETKELNISEELKRKDQSNRLIISIRLIIRG